MRQLLRPIVSRLNNLLARAVLTAIQQGAMQRLQVNILSGETADGIEHFEPAGFTSSPLPGAEVIILTLASGHRVAVVVADRRKRPQDLAPGAAALYCTADGIAQLIALPDGKFRLIGDLEVTGDVRDRCDSGGLTMQEMRDTYNAHTHPEPDGTTDAPSQKMGIRDGL
jgi:phage gp45-like